MATEEQKQELRHLCASSHERSVGLKLVNLARRLGLQLPAGERKWSKRLACTMIARHYGLRPEDVQVTAFESLMPVTPASLRLPAHIVRDIVGMSRFVPHEPAVTLLAAQNPHLATYNPHAAPIVLERTSRLQGPLVTVNARGRILFASDPAVEPLPQYLHDALDAFAYNRGIPRAFLLYDTVKCHNACSTDLVAELPNGVVAVMLQADDIRVSDIASKYPAGTFRDVRDIPYLKVQPDERLRRTGSDILDSTYGMRSLALFAPDRKTLLEIYPIVSVANNVVVRGQTSIPPDTLTFRVFPVSSDTIVVTTFLATNADGWGHFFGSDQIPFNGTSLCVTVVNTRTKHVGTYYLPTYNTSAQPSSGSDRRATGSASKRGATYLFTNVVGDIAVHKDIATFVLSRPISSACQCTIDANNLFCVFVVGLLWEDTTLYTRMTIPERDGEVPQLLPATGGKAAGRGAPASPTAVPRSSYCSGVALFARNQYAITYGRHSSTRVCLRTGATTPLEYTSAGSLNAQGFVKLNDTQFMVSTTAKSEDLETLAVLQDPQLPSDAIRVDMRELLRGRAGAAHMIFGHYQHTHSRNVYMLVDIHQPDEPASVLIGNLEIPSDLSSSYMTFDGGNRVYNVNVNGDSGYRRCIITTVLLSRESLRPLSVRETKGLSLEIDDVKGALAFPVSSGAERQSRAFSALRKVLTPQEASAWMTQSAAAHEDSDEGTSAGAGAGSGAGAGAANAGAANAGAANAGAANAGAANATITSTLADMGLEPQDLLRMKRLKRLNMSFMYSNRNWTEDDESTLAALLKLASRTK